MSKVKFGIIGYGTQGGFYGGAMAQGKVESMEVAAVCDIDQKALDKAKEVHPQAKQYTCYKEMIDSGDVDAVITTVPHYLHPEMAMYAIEKGIHVLNEKPAGVYTKQVKELNDFAAQHPDVTYAIMFNQRNNPLYKKIKELIDGGAIGNLRRTNWIITTWWRPQAYYDQSAWRATWGGEGGGVLVNQAPHQLDLIQWLAGVPESVYAKVRYGYQRDIVVEDEVTALLDYGNGATGVFVTCTHDLVGSDRLEIFGDKGKIVVENSKKAYLYKLEDSEQNINANFSQEDVKKLFSAQLKLEDYYEVESFEDTDGWGVQHVGVLENFGRHILHGEPILADGMEGINGVRLANAIHLSDWLGQEVSIKDFDDDKYLEELNKRIKDEGKFEERD